MNNPEATATIATAGVAALINFIIGEIFDIPPATVFVAFIGTFIGLVFRPSIEMPNTSFDKFMLFIKTCVLLVAITMMVSWLTPWITHLLPNVAQKTIAACLGFVCMLKREQINSLVDYLTNFVSTKVK